MGITIHHFEYMKSQILTNTNNKELSLKAIGVSSLLRTSSEVQS